MVLATIPPAIGLLRQCELQFRENTVAVAHDIRVRESHTTKAKLTQHSLISPQVELAIMGIPVQFDHQAFRRTKQVHNSKADDGLPSELIPKEAACSQLHPEPALGLGGVAPHFRGAFQQDLACDATTPNPLL